MRRTWAKERIGWHVFDRGPRRLALFREDEDYRQFLNIMKEAMALSGCLVWVYTLMSNHYHMVVYATSNELSRCMHHLNRMYSRYHNKKYGTEGTCFEGRYKAYKQWWRYLLFRRIAYVFLNPVAAGMVDRPEEYPWSNYRAFMGMEESPLNLDPSGVLGRLDPDIGAARVEFLRILEIEAARPKKPSGDRLSVREVHRQQFQWLLDQAGRRAEEFEGIDHRLIAMFWARECGVFPGAMAHVYPDTSISTVKSRLLRFQQRLNGDPKLKKRLASP